MSGPPEDGRSARSRPPLAGGAPVRAALPGPMPARGDDHDRHLLDITYEIAICSLSRIISPSLADFLA